MNRLVFLGLLALGLLVRVVMLLNYELVNGGEVDVYLADEGVVGLMGKHILEGRELPIFFYGQHYLGALEAYSAALSFALFGVGVIQLRIVTVAFSIAVAVAVYRFAAKTYSVQAARWATALVAASPMYFLQWNMKARGGFVEHLFLVFVVMLAFWSFYLKENRTNATGLYLGLACGIAMWVNQLVLAYLLLMGLLLLLARDSRGIRALLVGGFLGASVLIAYNVVYPVATFKTLARKAVTLNRVAVEDRQDNWLLRGVEKRVEAVSQGAAKLGLVFGVPPNPEVERLGLSQAALEGGRLTEARRWLSFIPVLVFGVGLFGALPRRREEDGSWEWMGSDQLLALFGLATFVVGYVSPRYMLAAYPIGAVLVGSVMTRLEGNRRRALQYGVFLVVAFNALSWADAFTLEARTDEERGTKLVAMIEEKGISTCYSAAPLYHLVFESNERVIFAPLQKDRYPKYNDFIEQSDSICYVYRDDQAAKGKRQHVALMDLLKREGVQYEHARSGTYNVLYNFDPRRAIRAEEVEALRYQETVKVGLGDILDADILETGGDE